MQLFETVLEAIKEKLVTIRIIRGLSVLLTMLTITTRYFQLTSQLTTICEHINILLLKSVLQIVAYGYVLYVCYFTPVLIIIIIAILATSDRKGEVLITICGAANILYIYSTRISERMTDMFALAMAGLSFFEYECFIQTKDSLLKWIQNLPSICQFYTAIAILILLACWVFSLLPLDDMFLRH